MRKQILQIAGVLAISLCTGQVALADVLDVGIPFKYQVVQGGATVSGTRVFIGLRFTPQGQYCPANHRDPDGNKYDHAHLPHDFPFWDYSTGIPINVTEEKSDWAWDEFYADYSRESGSTFAANCYTHCTGSPTVLSPDGYAQFTSGSSLCENTQKGKSYKTGDHVVSFAVEYTEWHSVCVLKHTSEKNASSGVYSKDWEWKPVLDPVRKRKL